MDCYKSPLHENAHVSTISRRLPTERLRSGLGSIPTALKGLGPPTLQICARHFSQPSLVGDHISISNTSPWKPKN
jgi:hypothetical protein